MKFLALLFSTSICFANNVELPENPSDSFEIENKPELVDEYAPVTPQFEQKRKTRVLVYGQNWGIIPWVGTALRTNTSPLAWEASFAAIPFNPSFFKVTTSALFPFGARQNDRGYFGIGAGFGSSSMGKEFGPGLIAPIFAGYEGSRFFIDAGIDVLVAKGGVYPIPTIRYGIHF